MFQEHRLFTWPTVQHDITLGLANAPLSCPDNKRLMAEHIALVGLSEFANAFPH